MDLLDSSNICFPWRDNDEIFSIITIIMDFFFSSEISKYLQLTFINVQYSQGKFHATNSIME